MSMLIDQLLSDAVRARSGVREAEQADGGVALQLAMLKHHAETFERACEIEGMEPEARKRLLTLFIEAAMPNYPQALEYQRLRATFQARLEREPMPMLLRGFAGE